ncbi:NUDIX domain-containing protein [Rhizobium mesosinicum]|uniref:NUDIX domain-containing protein n=1 Tax=Rhizobium mesosinicum TaxID=335017 RepID=A0ABS7GZF3_9HYPH|nr:NUDIX domain-containing protein [Rhizobium mesosinicum]MBW9055232.1 NUDIX domain-containing protein [Rhizobium mesosinicum]
MAVRSAGLLIYRFVDVAVEVLLVHPGGPFWKGKDEAAWSIPKGLVEEGEDELATARRETFEELGVNVSGPFERLGEYKQPGGKLVIVWLTEAERGFEPRAGLSSTFEMEWPPHSGKTEFFPEVDRAAWFCAEEAEFKMHKGQRPILQDFLKKKGKRNAQTS